MKFLIGGNAASAQTSPTAPTADAVRFRNRQSKSEWERRAGNGFLLCVFLARSFRLGRAFFYAFPSVGNAFAERKFVVPRNFSCRRRKEAFFMGRNLTLKITFSAVAAALTFVATVFIQVPSVDGGYTNLSDAIIFLTAALLPPCLQEVSARFSPICTFIRRQCFILWSYTGLKACSAGCC